MVDAAAGRIREVWGILIIAGVYAFTGISLYVLWFFKGRAHAYCKTCWMLGKLTDWFNLERSPQENGAEGEANSRRAEG